MLECRVDQIRGKDIQSAIIVRNRFNWTVKSVQTFSRHGYKNDATITQVVYERQDEFPFQAELAPLEEVVNGLKYPNPKPALRRLTASLIFTAIFGILWFMYPTLLNLSLLASLKAILETNNITFIPTILLGVTAVFGVLAIIFLIASIVRSVINSKSLKKRKIILEAARRIQKGLPPIEVPFKHKKHKKSDEPVIPLGVPAPVVHVAPAPVQPAPVVHPVVQPTPVQPAPQPAPRPVQPAPVQPAPQMAPRPVQPTPVQPAPQPVPHPVSPTPAQPAPQPVPHPVPPTPAQPAPQPAPHPVPPTPAQPAPQPVPHPVPPTPAQPAPQPSQPAPAQPAPAKPVEPTVVKPVDPNAK